MEQLYKVYLKADGKYGVVPIEVDPSSVTYITPDLSMKQSLKEGKFDSELSLNADFSIIGVNGEQIHVVGEHLSLVAKMLRNKKVLND